MKLLFLKEFGKAFIPQKIRPHLRRYLLKAGIVEVPYKYFGILFYLSVILTLFAYFSLIYPALDNQGIIQFFLYTFLFVALAMLAIAVIIFVVVYSYLDLKIFSRTKKIEDVLDGYLALVSENVKGGIGLDRALWEAVKPEFGVLAKEIQIVSKRVATGQPFEQALTEFSHKYESPMTKRSLNLIIEGLGSGAELASIIDKIVDNIRETKLLKAEIVAANTTYVIFIAMIVIFIAPLLFALSHELLIILLRFSQKLGPSLSRASVNLAFNFEQLAVQPEDFVKFSKITLGVIALFSSMIVSLINRGNIKSGVKYIPVFVVSSHLVYLLLLKVLTAMFGSMFV